jgi:hypothetical protein
MSDYTFQLPQVFKVRKFLILNPFKFAASIMNVDSN